MLFGQRETNVPFEHVFALLLLLLSVCICATHFVNISEWCDRIKWIKKRQQFVWRGKRISWISATFLFAAVIWWYFWNQLCLFETKAHFNDWEYKWDSVGEQVCENSLAHIFNVHMFDVRWSGFNGPGHNFLGIHNIKPSLFVVFFAWSLNSYMHNKKRIQYGFSIYHVNLTSCSLVAVQCVFDTRPQF